MAEWALLMFFATSIGVVYVALTLRATRAATKAAQDAVRVAGDVAEMQSQAYVHVQAVQSEFLEPNAPPDSLM